MATRTENLDIIRKFCYSEPVKECYEDCILFKYCNNYDEDDCLDWSDMPDEVIEEMANIIKRDKNVADAPTNPAHYGDSKNPWKCGDAMIQAFGEEAFLSFCLCNALKYIWRARSKGGNDDIRKAITYLEKFLEVEEKNNV